MVTKSMALGQHDRRPPRRPELCRAAAAPPPVCNRGAGRGLWAVGLTTADYIFILSAED